MAAGMPVFLRLGAQEYRYGERTRLTRIFDAYELLAGKGWGSRDIKALRRIVAGWRRAGKISITPEFFTYHERHNARALKALEGILGRIREEDALTTKFGRGAMLLDPSRKPMAWITLAVCHMRGRITLAVMYAAKRSGPRVAESRMLAYALIHDLVPMLTVMQIAQHFTRDHTTVLAGIKRVRETPRLFADFVEMRDQMKQCFANPTDIISPR